jgi:predicted metal-dependent peptidase
MKADAEERMMKAKINITYSNPFFAYLSLYLTIEEDKIGIIPKNCGMSVSPTGHLYYRKEFVDEITDAQLIGVITHELLHLALLHLVRGGRRQHLMWNISTDLCCNSILLKNGYELPKGLKPNSKNQFVIMGKTIENVDEKAAEEIYCLTDDMLVGNEKLIKEIRIGEKILCSDGKFHKILKKSQRKYNGNIKIIKIRGIPSLKITPNHKLIYAKDISKSYKNKKILSKPQWIMAEDVKKGDYLIMPYIKSHSKFLSFKLNFSKYWKQKQTNSRKIPKELILNKQIAEFLGLFFANGYTTLCNHIGGISFNVHRRDLINKTLKILKNEFNLKGSYYFQKQGKEGVSNVRFYSEVLRDFLRENIGTYSYNKIIPEWIIYNPNLKICEGFLRGVYECDGSLDMTHNIITYSTTSRKGALQLQKLLNRFKIFGNIIKNKKRDIHIKSQNKIIFKKDTHNLYIISCSDKKLFNILRWRYKRRKLHRYSIPLKEGIALKIKKVETRKYKGYVYNLKTSKQNYIANNILVHNCELPDIPEEKGGIIYITFDNHEGEGDKKDGTGEPLTESELQKLETEWFNKVQTAMVLAQQRGKLPLGMERYVDKLKEVEINWRVVLRRFIQQTIPTDYSWSKRSKKGYALDLYLPNVTKEKIDIVVGVDTSGSIGQEELTKFLSEIIGIAKTFREVIDMRIMFHDVEVHGDYLVKNGSIPAIMAMKIRGGGGTSHRHLLDLIKKDIRDCKCLVSFTDGWSDIEHIKLDDYKFTKLFIINKQGTIPKTKKGEATFIKLKDN